MAFQQCRAAGFLSTPPRPLAPASEQGPEAAYCRVVTTPISTGPLRASTPAINRSCRIVC